MAEKPQSTDEINKQMLAFFENLGFADKPKIIQTSK
jgi:hypothetical protein